MLAVTGLNVWKREVEAEKARAGATKSRVARLLKADTIDVPGIIQSMEEDRRWIEPELRRVFMDPWVQPKAKFHASLALLPGDPSQVAYLETRLLDSDPGQLTVLRDFLKPDAERVSPKLWAILDAAKPGEPLALSAAGALALYDPGSPKWSNLVRRVAEALVVVDPFLLEPWRDAFRSVRGRLTTPFAEIFRNKARPESQHLVAVSILTDCAADDPGLVAELLMDSDPRAYASLFPVAERQTEKASPVFQSELAKKIAPCWNDPPLDPS